MKRKKYPSKNNPKSEDISCEKVWEILGVKASISDNKDLLKKYSKREIFLAQFHILKCEKCTEKYHLTKERENSN